MTNQVLRCNRAVMSAELDLVGTHPGALEANTNHSCGFKGCCMRPKHSQGRFPGDIKAPTSDFLSYCQREGREHRTHRLRGLGCWQVVGNNHIWHSPSVSERQGELHGTFVLRLLVESRGAAPPRSSLDSSVTTGLRHELWLGPQGIK